MSQFTAPPGVWPVMLTPFRDDRSIDWAGLDALVDWYIGAGVAGLFAVCLSSEMYALSDEERLAVAGAVVKRAAGRAPVIASGTFGGPVEAQAEFVRRMAGTGVGAVVVLVSQMAAQDEPDAAWVARTARLLELTGSIPLGLYECPAPYHRLMSLEMLRWAAGSGRFHFLKDTCRDGARTAARCDVARGTGLSIFNAHATTLLATLRAGAAGFSGIAANYYPAVFARLCRVWESEPAAAERLQRFANLTHLLAHDKYPTRAKRFLGLIGLPAGPTCRTQEVDWTADDQAELEALRDEIAGLQGDGPRR